MRFSAESRVELRDGPPETGRAAWQAAGCALAVAICILATRPFVEMGVIDDWSYVKTAEMFARTGQFVYNGWGAVILGWQVPLGALGIKIFGFSFTAARAYMLPADLIGAWLCYRVLAGFGVNAWNSAFATLLLFLSPAVLPLEMIAMTDIPGFVAVLLCLYLCQQAANARTPAATILWLSVAAASNVVGGTVRQIAWLGALVLVPSTAWFLRGRPRVLLAGFVLGIASLAGIAGVMHWFNHHPNSVPEKLVPAHMSVHVALHLVAQMLHLFLCLQVLLLPLTISWLWRAVQLPRSIQLRIAAVFVLAAAVFTAMPKHGPALTWILPFAPHIMAALGANPGDFREMLGDHGSLLPMSVRVALSVLAVTAAYACVDFLFTSRRAEHAQSAGRHAAAWTALRWMLVPFFFANVLFLIPRGLTTKLYDRYLLVIMLLCLIFLLRVYQERITPHLSPASLVTLALVSGITIAATHDFFAMYRARAAAAAQVVSAGIPRTSITAGLEYDGFTQVMNGGQISGDYVDTPDTPATASLPPECKNWFARGTPLVQPEYYVMRTPLECFEPAQFPEVHYRTWLPPFHRAMYVGVMRGAYRPPSPMLKSAARQPR